MDMRCRANPVRNDPKMSDRFNIKEVFNSQTMRGRANVAKATWASLGLVYVLVKMHRRTSKRRETKLYCKGCQQAMPQG
ncbi:putative 60S ribosomal protein L33 isoform X2 [Drosophila sechellia]|uniref:putative 60S ribosomal protein L33 isoform X2 n=1 Tax=Drosophila sechellia TaxID=7238 RepID=UPI0013DE2A73|nr:putative 60S ribosomal protein L33 isoform X2 [Drosophila sechellia]